MAGSTITDYVYMDISIANQPAGRLVLGLHGYTVPRASMNFLELGELRLEAGAGETQLGTVVMLPCTLCGVSQCAGAHLLCCHDGAAVQP